MIRSIVLLRMLTWVALRMSKAELAACFSVAIGAWLAASFTTRADRNRESDECSFEFSLQLIPGRSITLMEVFLFLPLDCEDISSRGRWVGSNRIDEWIRDGALTYNQMLWLDHE